MTISDSKQTTGSCTATVTRGNGDIENFVGDKDKMRLDLFDGIWTLSSTHIINEKEQTYRDITIFFSDDGNIQNKTYKVARGSPIPGVSAAATWWIRTGSTANPFLGTTGEVTVTVDKTKNKVSASFNFEGEGSAPGKNGGTLDKLDKENVSVTSGNFELEGLFDGVKIQPTSENYFTAQIKGFEHHEIVDYRATELKLTHVSGTPNFNVVHWHGWSEHVFTQPGRHSVILSLSVAETVEVNKKYTISSDGPQFRAKCMDIEGSFVGYMGDSGDVTLTSLPAKGSSSGKLEGIINFVGKAPGFPDITVSSGSFSIENA